MNLLKDSLFQHSIIMIKYVFLPYELLLHSLGEIYKRKLLKVEQINISYPIQTPFPSIKSL